MEPLRGRDPWDGRERDPRERDREQRDRERERELHERERDLREREQERRRGYEREEPRPPGPSIKGRDWETRDYTDSRREWDGRGRQVFLTCLLEVCLAFVTVPAVGNRQMNLSCSASQRHA